MTCELLLSPQLRDLSTQDSLLPVIRDARAIFQKMSPLRKVDGTYYGNISYAGHVEGLTYPTAEYAIARLNGIEQQIVQPDLDQQLVGLEIRGSKIAEALLQLKENENTISKVYRQQLNHVYPMPLRITFGAATIALHTLFILNGYIAYDSATHMDLTAIPELAAFFLASGLGFHVEQEAVRHNLQRFDFQYQRLIRFLQETTTEGRENRIFISSSSLEKVPVDFHRILMDGRDRSHSLDSDAREKGISELGGPFFMTSIRKLVERAEEKDIFEGVQAAGDSTRHVLLDHVIYYDKVADEPVWLFFYRAARARPAGRKSTRTLSDALSELEWGRGPGWVPF